MTERITSSTELRAFVADNAGRRKIDTEASLELHTRAATQLDLLGQHVADLQQRLSEAELGGGQPVAAPPPAASAVGDGSESAMMILRNAQIAADETLAEAGRLRAEAVATLESAEARADARVNAALQEARGESLEIIDAANAQASDLNNANAKAADRAAFIQRQYAEKAAAVRQEAEALVDFTRKVESLADTELAIPELANLPLAAPPAPLADPAPSYEPIEAEPPAAVAEVATPEEQILDDVDLPAPPAEPLPPPPPADLLDLTASDLEAPAEKVPSIDEDLFGSDDDVVVDLREEAKDKAGFQFFSRD